MSDGIQELNKLEAIHLLLQDSLPTLLEAAKSEKERDQVRWLTSSARVAYLTAAEKILLKSNIEIQVLNQRLNDVADDIQGRKDALKDNDMLLGAALQILALAAAIALLVI